MFKIEPLKELNNLIVAKSFNRNFPGVLIQGDSLKILLDDIKEIKSYMRENNIGDAVEAVDFIIEKVESILFFYEKTLDEYNIDVPYVGRVSSGDK